MTLVTDATTNTPTFCTHSGVAISEITAGDWEHQFSSLTAGGNLDHHGLTVERETVWTSACLWYLSSHFLFKFLMSKLGDITLQPEKAKTFSEFVKFPRESFT